jgi:hypothetical protein
MDPLECGHTMIAHKIEQLMKPGWLQNVPVILMQRSWGVLMVGFDEGMNI